MNITPKKLIRKNITQKLKEGEWETIEDQDELNHLYALKIREELAEIKSSNHKDIMEFVDLIQVAFGYAKQNGFTQEQLGMAMVEKSVDKGVFGRLALNNLNPENPSNAIYFESIFNRSKVIDIIDMLLQHPDILEDAVDNEFTNWDAESLLKLAEGELPDSINEKWKKIVENNQETKEDSETNAFVFDKSLLEKQLEKAKATKIDYVLGVTHGEGNHAYALARNVDGFWDLLLSSINTNKDEFDKEVENLAKYFKATISEEK